MKLYHATPAENYETIKEEGLRPFPFKCDTKNFPECGNKIFFTEKKSEAIEFARRAALHYLEQGPVDWAILEVDLDDVLERCAFISRDKLFPSAPHAVEAYSEINDSICQADYSISFPCIIPPNKIRVAEMFDVSTTIKQS